MSYKSSSFLTAPFPRGHVNLSTPTFSNIILTETVINFIVDLEFNQKWLQEYLFAP